MLALPTAVKYRRSHSCTFPFHKRGEPLDIRDIEANEYDCLRRAVGFMAGAEEELKEIRGVLFKKSNRVRNQSSISEEKKKQIEKAITGRIKKVGLLPIYRDMWFWLEEGNTPADFIEEKTELLQGWRISPQEAHKYFHRVKKWREKGINPVLDSPPQEP